MKKATKIAFIFVSILSSYSFAQQQAQFTQFNDNMLYFNPAYAGTRGMMNITGVHRQQWVGFSGAPVSQTISVNTPLKKHENVGVGLSILNDKAGPLNQSWLNASFSYTLNFKRTKSKLTFGLNGGADLINANLSLLFVHDKEDENFSQNYQNKLSPNFGMGVYFHSKQFYAGISSPKIIEYNERKDQSSVFKNQRHFYAMIGGYLSINRMLKFRPSLLIKVTQGAPIALDCNAAFVVYDAFWFGANYRIGDSGGLYAQYQISNQFKLGYGFDISTTKLIQHNFGTHEVVLSYDFKFKNKRIISPRFF